MLTSFLKLIRIQNLIIVALTQYAMRYLIIMPLLSVSDFKLQLNAFDFFLLVMATICLTAAGYIINDYFDRKTDIINRKSGIIVGVKISRRNAMLLHVVFNLLGVGLGTYLSYKIGYLSFSIIFLFISGLLWYYSTTYKRQFLIGNVLVAFMTAMVPFMVVLYEIPLLNKIYRNVLWNSGNDLNHIIIWVLGFSFFAFVSTLIREIIKDAEDFEGDYEFGRNTMPIVMGTKNTKIILLVLILITLISLFMAWKLFIPDTISFWYFTILISLPYLFLGYKIIKSENKEDYSFASLLSKIIMLFGIAYAIPAYFIITSYLLL